MGLPGEEVRYQKKHHVATDCRYFILAIRSFVGRTDVTKLKDVNYHPVTRLVSLLTGWFCTETKNPTNGRAEINSFPAGTLLYPPNSCLDGQYANCMRRGVEERR